MHININDVLTATLAYLDEALSTEIIKAGITEDPVDLDKLIAMINDIRFQIDFTLMGSAVEVQELFDKYRNRPADESNIEIRTLLDLVTYIKTYVHDNYGQDVVNVGIACNTKGGIYYNLIERLADLITMHSTVDKLNTCQDESITQTMNTNAWIDLLRANPWLVAAVCLRLIPGYYVIDITVNKFNIEKVNSNATRSSN